MMKLEQELNKLQYRVTECRENIRMDQIKIEALQGEIAGLNRAIDAIQPLIEKP